MLRGQEMALAELLATLLGGGLCDPHFNKKGIAMELNVHETD